MDLHLAGKVLETHQLFQNLMQLFGLYNDYERVSIHSSILKLNSPFLDIVGFHYL